MMKTLNLPGAGRLVWRAKHSRQIVADAFGRTVALATPKPKPKPTSDDLRAAGVVLLAEMPDGVDPYDVLEVAGKMLIQADKAEPAKTTDVVDVEADRLVVKLRANHGD